VSVDEGGIKITIKMENSKADSYELLRKNTLLDKWDSIKKFEVLYPHTTLEWIDYTVEQGTTYYYAIRNYIVDTSSNFYGMYSEKIISDEIKADFEYMYLSDAEKTLTIKFNPKVSSIKNSIPE
jgi:hypothetical protein